MNPRAQTGSALLDALLATGLLIASAWLAAQVWMAATRQADGAADRMQASRLAAEQLSVLEWHSPLDNLAEPGEDRPDTAAPHGWVRRWHSTWDPATAQLTHRVEVEWRDRFGKTQRLQRQLLVFRAATLQPLP